MREIFREYGGAAAATISLFFSQRGGKELTDARITYRLTACRPLEIPAMIEEDTFAQIMAITKQQIQLHTQLPNRPYWNPSKTYSPVEIYQAAIQFTDDYNGPKPKTTLPPEKDVKLLADAIMSSPTKLDPGNQLKLALPFTDGDIVGAANLAMITTRIYARAGDKKAYPTINPTADEIKLWGSKIAQFETYTGEPNSDSLGDTYYFWTHFFAASSLRAINSHESKIIDIAFSRGTEIMTQVRRLAVKQPTMSRHREASIIGRNIGIAVIEEIGQNHPLPPS